MSNRIIVSRHPAAIEFIAKQLGGEFDQDWYGPGKGAVLIRAYGEIDPQDEGKVWEEIPVLAEATPEDVRGKVVYGNLPNHLQQYAQEVWNIEFTGTPPRGQEYTLADMEKAGARLVPYVVIRGTADDFANRFEVRS